MADFTVTPRAKLTPEQNKQLDTVLAEAAKDPNLQGEEPTASSVIVVDESVAGFYSPEKTSMKGLSYWRAGALYLSKKYRGKGLMKEVLRAFFDKHRPGITWIANDNHASIKTFTGIGFKEYSEREYGGMAGKWYTLSSSPGFQKGKWYQTLKPAANA